MDFERERDSKDRHHGKKSRSAKYQKSYQGENISLRDLAGEQQRWMFNIGMSRDEARIRQSRWPSGPGAANNLKNDSSNLKSFK